jgi:hypothetical protein
MTTAGQRRREARKTADQYRTSAEENVNLAGGERTAVLAILALEARLEELIAVLTPADGPGSPVPFRELT